MTPPLAPLDATVAWLDIATRGWGLVVVPPRHQRDIAEALAARVPGRLAIALSVEALHGDSYAGATGGFLYVGPEVAYDGEVAIWRALNGRRDWLSDRGVWVVVATTRQLERLATHAGDLASVARRCETVPFLPRQLSDDELVAARAELHAYYQRRFGRLDLRGFIRSEREDVSFPVEAIYQPLRGVVEARYAFVEPVAGLGPEEPPLPIVALLAARRREDPRSPRLVEAAPSPTLLVGGPGSGKSFFLRHCAIAASRADVFAAQDRPLPVYVSLAAMRAIAPNADLEDHAIDELLEAGLAAAHAVSGEAAAGRCLFLVDGLDEVGDARVQVAHQVAALASRYLGCAVVVTSRPGGIDTIDLPAVRIDVAPLGDAELTALLRSWCELYEIDRAGAAAAAGGRLEGERLAADVLASPSVVTLARTPLLATIVAIVHRAGVRLPEHRVELYEHMTRVLVERWNQLRSQQLGGLPPIRTADAIRLLGPIAHRLVRQGMDTAVDEESLRGLLQDELGHGTVRAFPDATSAIVTFRDSLGLLVEQAPRKYAFLHKTLGEFLAAHEAVRTGALEPLLRSGAAASPRWREVVLLALGIVGTLHANDRRLAACVESAVVTASKLRPAGGTDVPELLAGILTDDPDLSPELARRIVEELVPNWWFDALPADLAAYRRASEGRTRWGTLLRSRIAAAYAQGLRIPVASADEAERLHGVYLALNESGVPEGRWLCEWAVRWAVLPWAKVADATYIMFPGIQLESDGTVRVPSDDQLGRLFVELAIAGGCDVLVLDAENRIAGARSLTRVELVPRDPRLEIHPFELMFSTRPREPKFRAAALPALLQLWREVAERDPDGPEPPASVEEAYAIYGPCQRDEPPP